MIYNGQELGEQALGTEDYGGDDSRTTIFTTGAFPRYSIRQPKNKSSSARATDACCA